MDAHFFLLFLLPSLDDNVGLITEIKRKSPSKGEINKYVSVERTSSGYMQAGTSALSVLNEDIFEIFGIN